MKATIDMSFLCVKEIPLYQLENYLFYVACTRGIRIRDPIDKAINHHYTYYSDYRFQQRQMVTKNIIILEYQYQLNVSIFSIGLIKSNEKTYITSVHTHIG